MTDKKLTDRRLKPCKSCLHYKACITANYDMVKKTFECEHFEDNDLINHQKAEIENLKVENQSLRSAANSLKMHYEESQAEIERLKEKQEKCFYCTEQANKKISDIKAEAYKEFAERAKEFMHNKFKALDEYEFEYITERDINNLLKEMVGDDNESR